MNNDLLNKMKKGTCVLLSGALIASLFTGCQMKIEDNNFSISAICYDNEFPFVNEDGNEMVLLFSKAQNQDLFTCYAGYILDEEDNVYFENILTDVKMDLTFQVNYSKFGSQYYMVNMSDALNIIFPKYRKISFEKIQKYVDTILKEGYIENNSVINYSNGDVIIDELIELDIKKQLDNNENYSYVLQK